MLASGVIDVLPRLTTHTYERDVLEPTTMMGFSFSKVRYVSYSMSIPPILLLLMSSHTITLQPYFYDGLSFAGVAPYGDCADRLDYTSEQCLGLKICVNKGTTTIARTRELFPEANIVPMDSGMSAIQGLVSGECNALAGGSLTTLHETPSFNLEMCSIMKSDRPVTRRNLLQL